MYSRFDIQFGEEYRPCRLTRFVYPVSKPQGSNDWVFASILDSKLFPILQQHSVNKPILVFCPTRKGEVLPIRFAVDEWFSCADLVSIGCVQTAQLLAKEYDKAVKSKGSLPWSQPTRYGVDKLILVEHLPDKHYAELIISSTIKS